MPTKKKILVVEDDKFSYKLYTHLLTEAGFDVVFTPIATEAVEFVKLHKPNIIIMDLMLKDGNGFDAIRAIRALPNIKQVPIITLSNLSQDADIKEALKIGANKYFVKSNTRFQTIIETINEMLKMK